MPTIELLTLSIILNGVHVKKHGVAKSIWDAVTADLNSNGSFHNNDPKYIPLIARNVRAHFCEIERVFNAK